MPITNRFSTTTNGALAITGNTLGLSKISNQNRAGTIGAIGAFVTTNTALQVPTFPAGTTLNYTQNSSTAILNIPAGSTILYAELIWGGNYLTRDQNITSVLGNPISFTTPVSTYSITPSAVTASNQTFVSNSITFGFYTRSADVTTLIQAGGSGSYTTGAVPGLVDPLDASNGSINSAGWTLIVAYQNGTLPARNLTIYVAGNRVSADTGSADVAVSGFLTPSGGPVSGRLFLSSIEGDADLIGDQALFGPNFSSLNALSGPNNAVNNFFGSQVNNAVGNLDTTGTFGTRNQSASTGTNISAGRQGWDITSIDISPYLTNSQVSAAIRLTTNGDAYMLNTVGLQININSPTIQATKSVNKSVAAIGDILTYTVTIPNTGLLPANNVTFTDILPNGTSFIPGTVTVDNVPQTNANPAAGISLGTINNSASRTVTFQATVVSLPSQNPISNTANITFQYTPIAGGTTFNGLATSNSAGTQINLADINGTKSVNKIFTDIGETLTYSIALANIGNIAATNVIYTDPIPGGTTFIPGSVTVNGVTQAGANPANGISIGSIAANSTTTISFQVLVPSIPQTNPILNSGTTTYQYIPVPNQPAVSGTDTTNIVSTQVNNATVTMVKAVDKNFADIGDTLTYTVSFTGTGNTNANNIIFTDVIPTGTTFVLNSLTIDGTTQVGANPANGVNIGSIPSGTTKNVTFQVVVNTIPVSNVVSNGSNASYQYTVNPIQSPVTKNISSNLVSTQINNANVTLTKSTNKQFATIGETIGYTILITNSGNTAANNVQLTDPLPNGTILTLGSVTLNGVLQNVDSLVALPIGTIPAGATFILSFQVTVINITSQNPILNNAFASYIYTVNPSLPPTSKTANSNSVTSTIRLANLHANKSVDKTFAEVGDVLTYTFALTNDGNVAANNVLLSDSIADGTSFVPNSVIVNGVTQPGITPASINIGSINANTTITASFQVVITSIPNPNPISNSAFVSYNFIVDPNASPVNKNTTSTTTFTQVNDANVISAKTVDQAFATVGDILTYTVTLTNAGSVSADSPTFVDTNPDGTTFIPNTFLINGVLQNNADPNIGVPLPSIPANGSLTVSYQVTVTSLPTQNPTINSSSTQYSFILNPGDPPTIEISVSNTVSTQINLANVVIVKEVDLTIADVGQPITYTISLANLGNTTANNVIVTDIIPNGTTIVPNSIFIGGALQLGADPSTGLQVGSIPSGGFTTIVFQISANGLPSPNPIQNSASLQYSFIADPNLPALVRNAASNIVTTQINTANIIATKLTSTNFADVGDIILYATILTNNGNIPAANVTFTDIIPAGTLFIPNTVTINNVPIANANPANGISIGTIGANSSRTVAFQVFVPTIPAVNPITNQSGTTFQYTYDPSKPAVMQMVASSTVQTTINNASIAATKSADKQFANVNDIITYTTTLTNNGNTLASNVIFTDVIPNGTSFIPNSVTVNGNALPNVNPASGIAIDPIDPNTNTIISFQAQVNSIPNPNPIPNQSNTTYQYVIDPNLPPASANALSNVITTQINNATIIATKSVNTPNAAIGDIVTYTIAVTNTGNIPASATVLTDGLGPGASFIPNSVTINNVSQPGLDPSLGIHLDDISPGNTTFITFQVKILAIPPSGTLTNNALVNYEYAVNPAETPAIGSTVTNTTVTPIIDATLVINKSASTTFATIGDTITYTTTITNTGNIPANNVVFSDPIPSWTQFVAGSVVVDGTPLTSASIIDGVGINTITPNQIVTIVFQVQIVSNPTTLTPELQNLGFVNFQYNVGNALQAQPGNVETNVFVTSINSAILSAVKTTNTAFANIEDTITYTVLIQNNGNTNATNVNFSDMVPAGTTFVENSFTVNGSSLPGANPNYGVNIGTVNAGSSLTITFQVIVTSTPPSNPITNVASIQYAFIVDPASPPVTSTINSNSASTQINNATVTTVLQANRTIVSLGDVITYTATLTNTGNFPANSVLLINGIPEGALFVPNSVTLNGVSLPDASPTLGIPVGIIAPGDSATITFQFLASSIPPQGAIINQAITSYTYIVNPSQPPVTATSSSNTVNTAVVDASLSAIKNTDSLVQSTDGTITYTVVVQNNGNTTANTVTLTDLVPEGTAFIPNSVTINNVSVPGADPNVGIPLNSIAPSEIVTVTFQVIVQSIPSVNPISNTARIDYNFIADPTAPIISRTITSNPAFTQISDATILSLKAVNAQQATTGDILTYTITLENTGNIPTTNLTFSDTIPQGTTFVENSFTLNGTAILDANPNVGVTLPNLAANATHLISFQILINDSFSQESITNQSNTTYTIQPDPGQPPITETSTSNIVITNFVQAQLTITKTSNPTTVDIGGTILYISEVKNIGNVDAININFTDSIPAGTTFVPDSVTINGILQPGVNPENGIPIGTIPANSSKTILFQVQTNNPPTETEIVNQSSATYQYVSIPAAPPVNRSANSNIVTTSLQNANIISVKSADVTFVSIGQIITYTNTLQNIGSVPANNTVFIDNIPEGTIFIEDSLAINNVIQPGANPENGVTLGTIQPNETVTISFQVQLTNIPEGNTVINISDTSYEYQIDPSSPIIQRRSLSNAVNTEVRTANVSAIKSANRSITRIGQIITYTVAVTNAGTVPITNTLLIDAIAAGTTFVLNSILVDGIPRPNENPITGINLDIILPNNTIIVTFQVSVVSIPPQNNINNIAVIHYEYEPDPSAPPISETTSSNSTNIQFIDAILIATKSANTVLANIDETIEYTVFIQNNGSTTTNSIFFTDTIADGTVFIPGSVIVNNTVLPAADPNIGFSIPNVAAGQIATITFQVSVTNLPVVNPAPNTANIVYDFIFNPDFAPIQKSTTSNTTFVQINDADIVSLKTVDLTSVTIGDILTYTTTLTNTGNTDATAVVFTDNIPDGTTFIDGSVLVNNIPQLNANPSAGILVGTITPNTSIPVTFSVTVVALPASGHVQNQSTSRYTINAEEQISTSNITFTEVISANVIATKTTPIQYADLQTIIPYTISIINNGNIQVENIIVTDIIPANTSFIENSVIVNGNARPNDNPLNGIQIDNIPPNTTATILFQVRVTSIPQTNPISNTSTIEYEYTVPDRPPITETIISSAAATEINHANLNSNKAVDLAFATVGDTLTYTITLNQTGNVAVNDVIIQDIIPQGTTFIENSVIVNGETLPGVNPVSGIPIGTIIVGGDAIASFQVTVTSIPTPNELNNNAITTFNYIVDPNNVPVTNTTTTNTVTTTVQNDNVIAIKAVDFTSALPGQTLTYTITITNSGNITIEDLLLVDTAPVDTTFVIGSVTINGINQPNENPENGITLGNLAPNDSVIITFQVTISSSTLQSTINNDATISYTPIVGPIQPPITITKQINTVTKQTNTVTTTVVDPMVGIEKTTDKSIVVIGDIITFTLEIFNDSPIPTVSTSIIDSIPAGTTFIENSVTINSTPVPNVRPDTGINIGSLPADSVATITFQVLVTSIPSNSTIINSATVTAAFQLTPQDPIITFIVNSNIVRIPVQFVTATVTKNASVSSAYLNQYFDYTVRITNTSEISLSNISLQDTIPAGLQFINGTVFINGERSPLANPNIGFLVATNLEPNETIIVLFTVQVISPPINNQFKNTANISLQLQVSPTDPPITVTVTSNENIVTFVPENPDETLPNLNCFFDGERFIRITPQNARNYLWTWIWWN